MKTSKMLETLDTWDFKFNKWLFTTNDLKIIFSEESENSLNKSMVRQVKSGVLVKVCKGIYANKRANSKPLFSLESIALYLKPNDFIYLSLESVLSEQGLISQIPSCLTFMTTGRSQKFSTSFGNIEFIHTKRELENAKGTILFNQEKGIHEASSQTALRDLKRVGRNMNLVSIES